MNRYARILLFVMFFAATGCTASGYAANRVPEVPSNAAEISTDAIKAPSDMSHACGGASYTVDRSAVQPLALDRGERDVVFHCDDGSTPSVNE